MDVLRPPIVCIGGRCYRKNLTEDHFGEEEGGEEQYGGNTGHDEESYEDYRDYTEYVDEEECDADIEQTESGFKLQLAVPSLYFKYIIGKKGETKKRLENETRTQIRIPRQGEEGKIVVSSQDRNGVSSARTRIEVLVDSARQKQPFTHFLSLPVNLQQVQDNFQELQEDVLRFCDGDRGIDSSIFQNPDKLHLTLGTLVLADDAEIEKATQLLHSCQQQFVQSILRERPLVARLQGLEYMNDDPGEVDVLYCRIELQDGSDRLQMLADELVEKFVNSGLMQRQYDHVKLHITLMNTLFRKDSSGTTAPVGGSRDSRGGQGRPRESFDARRVLQQYGDYSLGTHTLKVVHLSQRYSTACNGYYVAAAKMDLPT